MPWKNLEPVAADAVLWLESSKEAEDDFALGAQRYIFG
jgi:hypothetical protein